ncbi:uncharacterized protein LOC134739774 [Pongo pygmaeus]|uniref:uncharacterized protein LOC134739774 n=1 Tax=Pongo pygmaeus TaxID=9600 RepID=UPI00300CD4D0
MKMEGSIWSAGPLAGTPNPKYSGATTRERTSRLWKHLWLQMEWAGMQQNICDHERQLWGQSFLYHQKFPPRPGKDSQHFHLRPLLQERPELDRRPGRDPACLAAASSCGNSRREKRLFRKKKREQELREMAWSTMKQEQSTRVKLLEELSWRSIQYASQSGKLREKSILEAREGASIESTVTFGHVQVEELTRDPRGDAE